MTLRRRPKRHYGAFGVIALSALVAPCFAAVSEPAPLREAVWTLPLVPVALQLETDGRLRWVELVFIPTGHRLACHGRTLQECRQAATQRPLKSYARRSNEPGRVLAVRIGPGKRPGEAALLRDLARASAVRQLSGRRDAGWTPAGSGAEYPIDRRRVLRAEARWTLWPHGEQLEVLRLR